MNLRAAGAIAAALALAAGAASPALAAYPDRPVRLLLPFAPGGGADAIARIITPKFHESLGQPWVVDNRGGAGGSIAAEMTARANPDGQTVFMGFSTVLTVNPLLYRLSFDVARDLAPVSMITAGQYLLVVHPSVKAESVAGLIALAKAKPGALAYGSAGIGTPLHLAAELFGARTGTRLNHVPYKGGGPASVAVLAGEVQVLFGSLPSSLPHARTGRLRALAVTGPARAPLAPELPTLVEAGLAGFDVRSWYGLLVPARTPAAIVHTLEAEAARALNLPDVKDALARLGLETAVKGPAAFAELIRQETAVWDKVIRAAGIRGE